jgi:hypothetical protein
MKTTLFIFALVICSFSFSQGLVDGSFKGKGNVDVDAGIIFSTDLERRTFYLLIHRFHRLES